MLRVKNTVVPSTRGIEPDFSFERKRSAASGVWTSSECIASMPMRQVTMTTKSAAARLSGSQPPSAIFSRLAQKKLVSTIRKTANAPIAAAGGQRHTSVMAL